jgi:hypothetical protein
VDAESSTGHTPVRTLPRRRRQQAGIPRQRYRNCAAVEQVDDNEILREPDILDALAWPTF